MRKRGVTRLIVRACAALGILAGTGALSHNRAQTKPPSFITFLDGQQQGYDIPFLYDGIMPQHIIVHLRINGWSPLPFVLDTGANAPLIIDEATVKQLGLKTFEGVTEGFPGKIKLTEAEIKTLSLVGDGGEVNFELERCLVSDLHAMRDTQGSIRPVGIIGAPMLDAITARFDFQKRRLRVFPKAHPPLKIPGAASLPLTFKNGVYYVTLAPTQGSSATLLVDTGSPTTSLPAAVASKLPTAAKTDSGYVSLDGAVHVVSLLLIKELDLGGIMLDNVSLLSEPDPKWVTLGVAVLSRFRVTFDFRNGFLTLERPTTPPTHSPVHGRTGITLTLDGSLSVASVRRESPGEKAGVRPGDRLLSVDGRPLQGLPHFMAECILGGFKDGEADLVIARGGEERRVKFRRLSRFDAPRGPLAGIEMYRPHDGHFTVNALEPGSPAAKAGLKKGDKIVSLDGQDVAGLKLDRLRQLFNLQELKVAYRRTDGAQPIEVTLKDAEKR
jgi:predicted aspartyl protease